jgi:hypothetical protein
VLTHTPYQIDQTPHPLAFLCYTSKSTATPSPPPPPQPPIKSSPTCHRRGAALSGSVCRIEANIDQERWAEANEQVGTLSFADDFLKSAMSLSHERDGT